MPGLFRLVLLAFLSHSSVTYPLRWIGSTIKHVVLYATYRVHDERMKSAGVARAYLDCDVQWAVLDSWTPHFPRLSLYSSEDFSPISWK